MTKSKYRVIGVMSGTSLDGLDIVHVEFNYDGSWSFNIIRAETISYTKLWKKTLKNLISHSLEELRSIDQKYTSYLASTINDFIKRNKILSIDAICSHGHTALHKPDDKLTYQIGNKKELSELTNHTVVCDFRIDDVKLGGQGAPLVPIGDELLFPEYDYCLNLGGFANVSTRINSARIAYDICPVNIVLNHYVSRIDLEFDDNGSIAASGGINEELLIELNELEFYNLKSPKSLGLEWVREIIIPLIDKYELSVKDILRTFVEHSAYQIASELNSLRQESVLVTGGGAYNFFLMERIKQLTNNRIEIPSLRLIEYKEALIFGFLGVLKLRNEINCLSSVTGAKTNHSSGYIYIP